MVNFQCFPVLYLPEICSQEWKVQYSGLNRCVLKGSTTLLSGTFKHPDHLTVKETFWIVNPAKGQEFINLLDLPDYRGRVQYLPNKNRTFIFRLINVRREDEGIYCFRILTNEEKERYLGFPGIELNVTGTV